MSVPGRFKYPFDKTGVSPDNLVYPETREVTKQARTIVPKEGLYFTQSLTIMFGDKQLVRGVDFKPTFLDEAATVRTNKEVCGGIYFINEKITGNVILRYQTVGGEFSNYSEANKNLIAALDGNSGSIRWDQIINIPEAFVPAAHLHRVDDLVGLAPAVIELQGIKRAIENLRSYRNVAIYRLIGSIHTRVNNFIESYNNNDTTMRDTLEEIKQRVGTERLISEPVFNLAKRALDKRMDEVEKKSSTILNSVIERNREIEGKINASVAKQAEIEEANNTLKQRLDRLSISVSYTGSKENGQFITVSKNGDNWTISQADPSWLDPTFQRISTLEGRTTQQAESIRLAEGRIGTIEGELPNFRNAKTLSEENAKAIAKNKSDLDEKLATLQGALTNQTQVINQKIEEVKTGLEAGIRTVQEGVLPAIQEITNPILTRVGKLETSATKNEHDIQEVDTKISRYINDNNQRVEAAETAHTKFVETQKAFNEGIKELVGSVSVQVEYTGNTENGNFISVDKAGTVFKIKYSDPQWLSVLQGNIQDLVNKDEAFAGRIGTLETTSNDHTEKLKVHRSDIDGLKARATALEAYVEEDATFKNKLRHDIDEATSHLNEQIVNLKEKDADFLSRIQALEGATNNFGISLEYTGKKGESGQYMTLVKTGNQYNIQYTDSATTLALVERTTNAETRLDGHDTTIQGHTTQLQNLNERINTVETEKTEAINALNTKLTENVKTLTDKIGELTQGASDGNKRLTTRIESVEALSATNQKGLAALKAKVDARTLTVSYTGSLGNDGQFITVEDRAEGGWVIKQADPSWLETLKTSIDGLTQEKGEHATRIKNLETAIRETNENVLTNVHSLDSHATRLSTLEGKIQATETSLTKAKEKQTAFEKEVKDAVAKINAVDLNQGSRLDALENFRNSLRLEVEYRGRTGDEWITSNELPNHGGWKITYEKPMWAEVLARDLQALTGDFGEFKERTISLERSSETNSNAINELKSKTKDLDSKVVTQGKSITTLNTAIETEKEIARTAEIGLQGKIDALRESHINLVNGLDDKITGIANGLIAPVTERVGALETGLSSAKEKQKTDKEELTGSIGELGKQIQSLRQSLSEATGGSTERTEQLERRVSALETAKSTLETGLANAVKAKTALEESVNTRFGLTNSTLSALNERTATQSTNIEALKAEDVKINRRIDDLVTEVGKKATTASVTALDSKLTNLINTTKEGLEGKVAQAKTDAIAAAEAYTNGVRDTLNTKLAKATETANSSVEALTAKLSGIESKVAAAEKANAATDKKFEDYKAGEPTRLSTHQQTVVKPAIDNAVNELRTEVQAREEEEKQKTNKYRETMNEILEFLQNYFVRADGPYLKTNMPKFELMPVNTVNLEDNSKIEEEHEPYMERQLHEKTVYPKILYPYSQFQPIEIGVEVRVVKQGATFHFGYLGFKERDPNGVIISENHASIQKNSTIELVSIRRDESGYSVDFGGNEVPRGSGLIIYPKTGLDYDKPESYQVFDYNDFFNAQGQTGLQHLSAQEHILKIDPKVSYVASKINGDFGYNTPLTTDDVEYGYTNGQWRRLSMRIDGGWWRSETGEHRSDKMPFAGTKFIVPAIESAQIDGIEFRNFYVRPVEEKMTLDNLPGIEAYLDKWLKKKVVEQASLPPDSRWDISRFRIQPGAENFSSVGVDEHDNLEVRGVVYYDTVGKGKRGVFAPTTEIAVTESKTWKVPDEYEGRVALITVRAASRNEVGKVIHSCVRQVMVTLTGGTEIPIQVGDISSFGTHVTVSNAIDYPDAIVGRIESPSGSRLNTGLVSIKV